MTAGPNKTRRFRFRFSLRTLFIFMTLICAYFGAWEATKRYGVPVARDTPIANVTIVDSTGRHGVSVAGDTATANASSPAPFRIARDEWKLEEEPKGAWWDLSQHRCYYLWLFGPRFRLPFKGKPELEYDKPARQY